MLNKHTQRTLRETAANWLLRLREIELDHPDRARFERWLLESEAHQTAYSEMERIWGKLDSPHEMDLLADGLKQRKQRAKGNRVKTAIATFSITVAALLGFNAYQHWQAQPLAHMAAVGRPGTISTQQLEDGSTLTLNANTALEITFYRNKRLVTLTRGELIFDVAPDQSRPFIVEAGNARVTVLGTRFAVNRLQTLVRVSVDHGRVKVESQDAYGKTTSEALMIGNGEVAEVRGNQQPAKINRPALDAFSFANGVITFTQAELPEIAETLSRYTRHPVELQSADRLHNHVSARIKARNVNLFLSGLPDLAPVTVKQELERTVIIGKQANQK